VVAIGEKSSRLSLESVGPTTSMVENDKTGIHLFPCTACDSVRFGASSFLEATLPDVSIRLISLAKLIGMTFGGFHWCRIPMSALHSSTLEVSRRAGSVPRS